ncbi:translation initiation factor [Rhynchospora pubera]|uniref:Translation initiation factor n=1 Tax=Rhynchospora pubera TaxID=906938 RepID=A0AAV8HFF9_9POAL|nr:translation initiation factor [Rhynchospora pubera]
MPRVRKGASKKPPPVPKSKPDKPTANVTATAENPIDLHKSYNKREVERRIAALQAISEAETESLLSRLRFVMSCMTKEQMEMPALQFFKEHFPNMEVVRNEKYSTFELKWKDDDVSEKGHNGFGGNNGASVAPSAGGLRFSIDSVRKSLLEAVGTNYPDFVGASSSLQTPGAISSRLSFGMTPKTVRLPKNGEMLLSVRGSPLGVYKDENLASISTIHESADGSPSEGSQL